MSKKDVKLQFRLSKEPSQCHISVAKGQSMNKCIEVSCAAPQRLHMEGSRHPLLERLSSVGNLSWNTLHTKKDLDGEIAACHIILLQLRD